jgi:Protein of unknown function (DUF429)
MRRIQPWWGSSERRGAVSSRCAMSTGVGALGHPGAGASVPGWMQVGFGLYAALAANGHAPIEVFPYAGFRLLSPTKLPKKTTRAGIVERVVRLEAQGIAAPWMGLWSHDALDATLAALVACGQLRGLPSRLVAAMTTQRSGSREPAEGS